MVTRRYHRLARFHPNQEINRWRSPGTVLWSYELTKHDHLTESYRLARRLDLYYTTNTHF